MDDGLQALIDVQVGQRRNGRKRTLAVWIDTAFNGGLVLPRHEIKRLRLKESSLTPAILADGQQVELPTYECYLNVLAKKIAHRLLPTTV